MANDEQYAAELEAMSDLSLAMRAASTMECMANSTSPKAYQEGARQIALELERRARLTPLIPDPDIDKKPPRFRYGKNRAEMNGYLTDLVAEELRKYSLDLAVLPSPHGELRIRHIAAGWGQFFTDIKFETRA